jgi:hypothetical protein
MCFPAIWTFLSKKRATRSSLAQKRRYYRKSFRRERRPTCTLCSSRRFDQRKERRPDAPHRLQDLAGAAHGRAIR